MARRRVRWANLGRSAALLAAGAIVVARGCGGAPPAARLPVPLVPPRGAPVAPVSPRPAPRARDVNSGDQARRDRPARSNRPRRPHGSRRPLRKRDRPLVLHRRQLLPSTSRERTPPSPPPLSRPRFTPPAPPPPPEV